MQKTLKHRPTMLLIARILGFLCFVGAVLSLSVAGAAHFDALLLSGAFLFSASMMSETVRRRSRPSSTLELGAALAALGAEHDALAARLKAVEACLGLGIDQPVRDVVDETGAEASRPSKPHAATQSGRDNVVRLFADRQRAKPE